MVPQLQIGINAPEMVLQNTPDTFLVPMELFLIFYGLKNSCRSPAIKKLRIIQDEDVPSMSNAELITPPINEKNSNNNC